MGEENIVLDETGKRIRVERVVRGLYGKEREGKRINWDAHE